MTAIVTELVNMASDPSVLITDLLRRALVAARRLGVVEFVDWINGELNGYSALKYDDPDSLPEYRKIQGQLVVENPRIGDIPFIAPHEISDLLTEFTFVQSVPELVDLTSRDGVIKSYFSPELEAQIMQMMRSQVGYVMRPALVLSASQLTGLVEIIRNRVLDWALDLEDKGVVGEGLSFTQREKDIVKEHHYHFSNVSGSQIQIGSHGASQVQNEQPVDSKQVQELIIALSAIVNQSYLSDGVVGELRAELATLKAQLESPKPKWEIMKSTAKSIKAIAEGAAGNILGALAQPHVATLIGLAGS